MKGIGIPRGTLFESQTTGPQTTGPQTTDLPLPTWSLTVRPWQVTKTQKERKHCFQGRKCEASGTYSTKKKIKTLCYIRIYTPNLFHRDPLNHATNLAFLDFLLAPKKIPSAKKSSPLTVLFVPLFAGRGALAADDGFPHSAAPVAGLFRNPPAVFLVNCLGSN